jgi:2,3-dihydroxybenzoate decarboxylase
MIEPLLARGLDGAIYGFAVECGMHLLTIITSGVFDRFPKLQMVFGNFKADYGATTCSGLH